MACVLLVIWVSHAKMAEPNEIPFGMADLNGPKNHALDRSTYRCHLANTTKWSVLSGNVGCRYHRFSNLFLCSHPTVAIVLLIHAATFCYWVHLKTVNMAITMSLLLRKYVSHLTWILFLASNDTGSMSGFTVLLQRHVETKQELGVLTAINRSYVSKQEVMSHPTHSSIYC